MEYEPRGEVTITDALVRAETAGLHRLVRCGSNRFLKV